MAKAFLGFIPAALMATLEADGKAILKWALTETQALVAIATNNTGFVGTVSNMIHEFTGKAGDGLSGAEKLAKVVEMAVPELVKVLSAGKDAFPVIETEMFDLGREAVQSIYNSIHNTSAGAILDVIGVPVPAKAGE
jgi:hypothetical protein